MRFCVGDDNDHAGVAADGDSNRDLRAVQAAAGGHGPGPGPYAQSDRRDEGPRRYDFV